MNNTTMKRNQFPVRLPGQIGNLNRIMESATEPPKDYIWNKDGILYIWDCCEWVPVMDFLSFNCHDHGHHHHCDHCDDCNESELWKRFKQLKQDLINQIAEFLRSMGSWDGNDLERRIIALENKEDKDTIYDDSALVARVVALENKEDHDTIDEPIPTDDLDDIINP